MQVFWKRERGRSDNRSGRREREQLDDQNAPDDEFAPPAGVVALFDPGEPVRLCLGVEKVEEALGERRIVGAADAIFWQ